MQNHLSIFSNCSFTRRSKFKILLSESKRKVSSANSVVSNCEASGKSLMYIKNKIGPREEPCGTPHDIFCLLDLHEGFYYVLISVG